MHHTCSGCNGHGYRDRTDLIENKKCETCQGHGSYDTCLAHPGERFPPGGQCGTCAGYIAAGL